MFRKNYLISLLTIALLLAGSIAVFAQTQPVTGKVVLKKADGSTAPIQGALVEVFRTDIKAKMPSDKTNKKGEFNFAGLPLGATFVLSVSAPGAKPGYLPNVKAGNENLLITLSEGDGRRWTEEEIRAAIAGADTAIPTNTSTELTAEQKKAQEDRAKLEAEYAAKKQKVEQSTATIQKSLDEGSAAFKEKNYDLAIIKFEEGYQADPKYVGSAPLLLRNKGAALQERGRNFHNQGATATDAAVKIEHYKKSNQDFSDAVEAYNAAWTILKTAPAADITDQQNYQNNKSATLKGFADLVRVMVLTEKVPAEKIPTIVSMLAEYTAVETDSAKKAQAQVYEADLYRITGDSKSAVEAYRKVLTTSPDNADAMAGLGLSLVNIGYNSDGSINETVMQEAINHLQRFTEVAPENHSLKESVKGTVEYLKTMKLKPEKTTTTKKKKG